MKDQALQRELLPGPKRKKRIIAKRGAEHLVLKLDDVALFVVYERIVFVFDRQGNKYLSDRNLQSTVDGLDPEMFFRVNRQAVVNLHYIKSFRTIENSKIRIELTVEGILDDLVVSQERTSLFKEWIAGETVF
jgi:DNA-binding LytR/AlgR family response regulator